MERFNALGRGMQLMLVAGVLLLIDTFLDWQSITIGPFTVGRNAWNGFGGVVLGLLSIVLVAWLLVRLASNERRRPVSHTMIAAFLGFLIFIIALLKNLVDDYSTFWSYVGVLLAFLVAAGAWMQVQAAGGVDSLRSEANSLMPSSPKQTASQAPTEPDPPPPPPPPMQPTAPESSAEDAPEAEPPAAQAPPSEPSEEPGSEQPT